MIPPFRADGFLPTGAHETDAREVEQKLVAVFAASVTRRDLYRDWRRRREAVFQVVVAQSELVDGSFATLKLDPQDVDVVTCVDGDLIDQLPLQEKQRLLELFNNHLRAKLEFGCDSYLLTVRPVGHPERATYEQWAAYWDRQWSRGRAGVHKGYLDVRGDP